MTDYQVLQARPSFLREPKSPVLRALLETEDSDRSVVVDVTAWPSTKRRAFVNNLRLQVRLRGRIHGQPLFVRSRAVTLAGTVTLYLWVDRTPANPSRLRPLEAASLAASPDSEKK